MSMMGFMARVPRGFEAATETELPRPVLPSAPALRTAAPSTSVDASSEFEGRLRCKETLRVDGRIKGSVECEKMVLVGEGARVQASIVADEVRISGIVEGDITARRKITLERTAVVIGDLTTPGIVIEEGAKLKGRIVIGSDVEPVLDSQPAKDAKKAPSRKLEAATPKSDGAASPQLGSALA
jgi:cytoskeletal protein CcmA (bactofilin family)